MTSRAARILAVLSCRPMDEVQLYELVHPEGGVDDLEAFQEVLAGLERSGLVERGAHPGHRARDRAGRFLMVALTERGERAARERELVEEPTGAPRGPGRLRRLARRFLEAAFPRRRDDPPDLP